MGHVVNPVSWRLSSIAVWKNSFAVNDFINYGSLNILTRNIIKIIEILCLKKFVKNDYYFVFGGSKYVSFNKKSLFFINFKSRFYYLIFSKVPIFVLKKKFSIITAYKESINNYFIIKKLGLIFYSNKCLLNNHVYNYYKLNRYAGFKKKDANKRLKWSGNHTLFIRLSGRLKYYKLFINKFSKCDDTFIFFNTDYYIKGNRKNSYINTYLKNLILRKKHKLFTNRKLALSTTNWSPINVKKLFNTIVIKRFIRNKPSREYNRFKFDSNNKLRLWARYIIIYKIWRAFFELPAIFCLKEFLYKFIAKYMGIQQSNLYIYIYLGRGISYVGANIMRDFILIKIKQKFKVAQLYKASAGYLLKLLRLKIIKGFKIFLAGRFSRKDRATFTWRKIGKLPLSTKLAYIDYASGHVAVRYSTCAVKVWIYF